MNSLESIQGLIQLKLQRFDTLKRMPVWFQLLCRHFPYLVVSPSSIDDPEVVSSQQRPFEFNISFFTFTSNTSIECMQYILESILLFLTRISCHTSSSSALSSPIELLCLYHTSSQIILPLNLNQSTNLDGDPSIPLI